MRKTTEKKSTQSTVKNCGGRCGKKKEKTEKNTKNCK